MAEGDLCARWAGLAADVLKVAHHGSRTSTSAPLVEAVRPRLAVIGVGRRNPYGHPSGGVLSRLEASRVRILRTDRDGTFALDFAAGRILPSLAGLPGGVAP